MNNEIKHINEAFICLNRISPRSGSESMLFNLFEGSYGSFKEMENSLENICRNMEKQKTNKIKPHDIATLKYFQKKFLRFVDDCKQKEYKQIANIFADKAARIDTMLHNITKKIMFTLGHTPRHILLKNPFFYKLQLDQINNYISADDKKKFQEICKMIISRAIDIQHINEQKKLQKNTVSPILIKKNNTIIHSGLSDATFDDAGKPDTKAILQKKHMEKDTPGFWDGREEYGIVDT